MWLFALFILVPLIEIALFIQVGGWLTLWPTLAIVVATAVIGTWLVRQQGARVMRDMQRAMEELGDPLAPLAHGAMILFAGALLLTPGFLTDAVGFALLVPAVRKAVMRWLAQDRVRVHVFGRGAGGPGQAAGTRGAGPARPGGPGGQGGPRSSGTGHGDVIDAEFRDLSAPAEAEAPEADAAPGPGRRSPWQ